MQVCSRCSSRAGTASGGCSCPGGLVSRKGVRARGIPMKSQILPELLPAEQGLDLCCPHGVVKCPAAPLTPLCRWATLVLLNKAAIRQLLELWRFGWPGFFSFSSSCFCSGTPERFIETTSKGLRVEGMDVLS